jgi:hypothetical protein
MPNIEYCLRQWLLPLFLFQIPNGNWRHLRYHFECASSTAVGDWDFPQTKQAVVVDSFDIKPA